MESRINKVVSSNISGKKMATIMFAIISTHSKVLDTYTFYREKSRAIQSGNFVEYLLSIPESQLTRFEELSGVKLEEQPKMLLN